MLRALLIDDEIASTRSLEILLSQFCKQVEVVGVARSVDEGLVKRSRLSPDIVFLDIEMPGGTGFDFLEKCIDINFEVIFITAHDSYAVKAFKYSAIDFILKPIEIDELVKAVEKVSTLKEKNFDNRNRYNALFDNLRSIIPNKLVVASNGKFEYIDLRNVLFVEYQSSRLNVKFVDGSSMIVDEDIENLMDQIFEKSFYQISQNQIVNLEMVKKVDKSGNGKLVLINDSQLQVDSSRKEGLIMKLLNLNSNL